MKRNINVLILMLLLAPVIVKANTCTAEDKAMLLNAATMVEVNYVEGFVKLDPSQYPTSDSADEDDEDRGDIFKSVMEINVYNLTENLYIKATNSFTKEEFYIYHYDLEDGIYTHIQEEQYYISTYTFEVMAFIDTDCVGETFAIKYLTVPKYNELTNSDICNGYEDQVLCQKYTTIDNLTEYDVYKKIEELKALEEEEESSENNNLFLTFLKDNMYYIIGFILLVIICVVAKLVITKKRSENLK
ncbi:MAG: hypothetical protein R3Y13_04185 [bacterium]